MPHDFSHALTTHAEARCNQRGIRQEAIRLLLDYGTSIMRHGSEVIYLDQRARARMRNDIGRTAYAKVERRLDFYVVVASDGPVITCVPRTRRIWTN